jgi:hypothetical protein
MAQNWTDNCFQSDHQGQTDLQNMENNFQCLKSTFEGSGQPSNPVPGMQWYDSGNKVPRIRNYNNTVWLGVMAASANHKVWVYQNSADEGWAIDATVVDCVAAFKGGGTGNPYNVSAGQMAGTWQQPDHILTKAELPNDTTGDSASPATLMYYNESPGGVSGGAALTAFEFSPDGYVSSWYTANPLGYKISPHYHTLGSGNAHNHGLLYRPAAAVGTLQYMDI